MKILMIVEMCTMLIQFLQMSFRHAIMSVIGGMTMTMKIMKMDAKIIMMMNMTTPTNYTIFKTIYSIVHHHVTSYVDFPL